MSRLRRFFFKFLILAAMLLGLPYLEFPPQTTYVSHAPFSWIAFALYALLISACLAPLIINAYQSRKEVEARTRPARSYPWWGWLGFICAAMAWVLTWTRFDWFAGLQPHTFTPLWLSFILVINGLSYWYNGKCMLLNRPVYFLLLFPTSAVFWWFFEYLNRFVQNWFYTGPEFSAWEYHGNIFGMPRCPFRPCCRRFWASTTGFYRPTGSRKNLEIIARCVFHILKSWQF
jgi:hypothetical protein